MNKKLILIASMALALGACSEKQETAPMEGATEEQTMMDKTKEMAGDAAEAVKDTTGEMVEGAGGMATSAKDAVSEKTGERVDAAKEMVHDTAQSIADATADEAEGATMDEATEAASGAMQDAGSAMGQ